MPIITSLDQIRNLQERYPFREEELEILARCHEHLASHPNEDFLVTLMKASPYTFYFLPGDELTTRIRWIEDHILPGGFASNLRAALGSDSFVNYANAGVDTNLERFIEGVTDTGRRGPKHATRMLYAIVGEDQDAKAYVDLAIRLCLAAEALASPNLNSQKCFDKLHDFQGLIYSMSEALRKAQDGVELSLQLFYDWSQRDFPLLAAPLSMFMHYLLFHGESFPDNRVPWAQPQLEQKSSIFKSHDSPLLAALSFMSPLCDTKWHRLYSSFMDGRSFNRLKCAVLGYQGPTVVVIRTTVNHVIGALGDTKWLDERNFNGTAESFLFALAPAVKVHKPTGGESNFVYLHTKDRRGILDPQHNGLPHGIGFGGSLSEPRLFVPESLEQCKAGYLDGTYEPGDILPPETLEQFEIASIEIWAVGGDEIVKFGLESRAEYRDTQDAIIDRARRIANKEWLAEDMEKGIYGDTKIFAHQEQVRGRNDFVVDDKHGGYKLVR